MDYPVAAILAGGMATYVVATVVAAGLARGGFPIPPGDRRIGCIDGLRGYLAVSVLIHHFIIWMQVSRLGGEWTVPTIHVFNQLGAGAVGLFFMTTGFVFYPRILVGLRRTSWPAVYLARGFRIVPLIVVSVGLVTAVIALRTGQAPDGAYPKAALRWITAWGEPPLLRYPDSGRLNAYVLWSLWYEWLFYIFVLPACALAMDLVRGRLPSWTVPCTLLAGCLVLWRQRQAYPMVTFTPLFACGMLAFECQRRTGIAALLRTRGAGLMAVVALCFGTVAFPIPFGAALPLFAVFFACVACGNSLGGILASSGALVLGECSYGIYLLHGLALGLLFVEGAPLIDAVSTWQLPFVSSILAALVVGVTALLYLGVERPAIRTGAHLARLWTHRRIRADSPELEVAP